MKVLSMVLHFFANTMATGPAYASKVVQETSLLHMLTHLIDARLLEKLEIHELGSVARIIYHAATKLCYTRENDNESDDEDEEDIVGVVVATGHAILDLCQEI